jgi:glycosyltransferase involved in cell wall biosynthesis
MLSLVIPVYKNEENLPRLLVELEGLAGQLDDELEIVFVVDGSPDRSLAYLHKHLPAWKLPAQLVELSRNFGSFAAVSAGLAQARGDFMAVLAADLQEPPQLVVEFHRVLASGEADVVFGHRVGRADPLWSRVLSNAFWSLYRRFVLPEMPKGGVDVFGCTRQVCEQLLQLKELHTNLIALVLWLGFRRRFVPYERLARREGKSAWTLARKLRYALDSVFSFTDLPVRALLLLGTAGMVFAVVAGATVLLMWSIGRIPVLGYTPLMLVMTFFGGLSALGLGIIGQYVWLSLQNARGRPSAVVKSRRIYEANAAHEPVDRPRATAGDYERTSARNSS